METSEYNFYYEPYHRVPMNSATTQKDSTECNSMGTYSTSSAWSRSKKRVMTTTYIDGTTVLGQNDSPCSMKDLFPKGKGRQRPLYSSEKKNTRTAYMSLLPIDRSNNRSEKSPSPLAMGKTVQSPRLPEALSKSANIRNKRSPCVMIFDDNSQSKLYARCATTHASGAWIRRYKSVNESQILSNLLRDQPYQDKILLKKRRYQQLLLL